jgi:hypothetical protein
MCGHPFLILLHCFKCFIVIYWGSVQLVGLCPLCSLQHCHAALWTAAVRLAYCRQHSAPLSETPLHPTYIRNLLQQCGCDVWCMLRDHLCHGTSSSMSTRALTLVWQQLVQVLQSAENGCAGTPWVINFAAKTGTAMIAMQAVPADLKLQGVTSRMMPGCAASMVRVRRTDSFPQQAASI